MRTISTGIHGSLGLGAVHTALLSLVTLALVGVFAPTAPAEAQSYRPVVRVDSDVITAYEISQRQTFLTLLRAPGDVRALAQDQLIKERLQLREARDAGIEIDADEVEAGMFEFAQRGNLETEQFVQLLAQGGVAEGTFRDFVTAGVAWREFVKATFSPMVSISEADIDAAIATAVPPKGLRVLMAEIVLPAGDAATRKASLARAGRLTNLEEADFYDAAIRFSVGASRNNFGKMNWVDITALPANVGAAVRGLQPGQTSRIIQNGEDIRLYYMRDRETVSGQERTAVEYAALHLAGGQSPTNQTEAEKIRARVTSCDDLYPIARALPPEQLVREEVLESAVPSAYAGEIARLDPGEISTRVTSANGAMVVLMLCKRGNEQPRSVTRSAVKEQLQTKRISTLATTYLSEVRANAHIEIIGR